MRRELPIYRFAHVSARVEDARDLVPLEAVDSGRLLEGVTFLHGREGHVRQRLHFFGKCSRQAKITEDDPALFEVGNQEVAGLEVAMDHVCAVKEFHCAQQVVYH